MNDFLSFLRVLFSVATTRYKHDPVRDAFIDNVVDDNPNAKGNIFGIKLVEACRNGDPAAIRLAIDRASNIISLKECRNEAEKVLSNLTINKTM